MSLPLFAGYTSKEEALLAGLFGPFAVAFLPPEGGSGLLSSSFFRSSAFLAARWISSLISFKVSAPKRFYENGPSGTGQMAGGPGIPLDR